MERVVGKVDGLLMLMDWEVVEEAACKVKSFDFPRAPSHLAPKSARELLA